MKKSIKFLKKTFHFLMSHATNGINKYFFVAVILITNYKLSQFDLSKSGVGFFTIITLYYACIVGVISFIITYYSIHRSRMIKPKYFIIKMGFMIIIFLGASLCPRIILDQSIVNFFSIFLGVIIGFFLGGIVAYNTKIEIYNFYFVKFKSTADVLKYELGSKLDYLLNH